MKFNWCYFITNKLKGKLMFLHIDIDCFFVSAHRSIDHTLKNKTVAVGSRSNLDIFEKQRNHTRLINKNSGAFVTPVFHSIRDNDFRSRFVDNIKGKDKIRGIVVTSSYEAREFGVKTAMSLEQSLRIYPQLIVVPSNYPLYHELSYNINEYLKTKIPKVEQFSIDEWFGDISNYIQNEDSQSFALQIQREIIEKFDIPVSIGISKAKWISKLATEDAKPLGIYKVDNIQNYIKNIPIKEFPGLGKGYQVRLQGRGISTLGDIKKYKALFYSWGKPGISLYNRIHGTDKETIQIQSPKKSIGLSRTFDPVFDNNEIKRRTLIMARNIAFMTKQLNVNPTTYFLKINYRYNHKEKQSISINRIFSEQLFKDEIIKLFNTIHTKDYGVIKLTISVSNFIEQTKQTFSLLDLQNDHKKKNLSDSMQKLRNKFGLDIIKNANEL